MQMPRSPSLSLSPTRLTCDIILQTFPVCLISHFSSDDAFIFPIDVNGKDSLSLLCHNKKVASLVLKECNAIGKKSGFKTMELLQAVILTPDEWTPESGLVTAAQKINRSAIAKQFAPEIKVGRFYLNRVIPILIVYPSQGGLQALDA